MAFGKYLQGEMSLVRVFLCLFVLNGKASFSKYNYTYNRGLIEISLAGGKMSQ